MMEISVSKIKAAKFFLLGLSGTSASVFLIWKGISILQNASGTSFLETVVPITLLIVCFFALLLFGSPTLIFGTRFFALKPVVLISSEGIEDKRLNLGLIKWGEINSISSHKMPPVTYLSIGLQSPEKFINKLPIFEKIICKINGKSYSDTFDVRFTELNTPIDEAFDFILDLKFENVICKRLEM